LAGASVLISTKRQLPAARALLELDGLARRILLCPPDVDPAHIPALLEEAGVDAVVTDGTGPAAAPPDRVRRVELVETEGAPPPRSGVTEWILFTSGTTGRPKLVQHTLASLTGPLAEGPVAVSDAIWSTFYDIRRYGGLQILLRALLGGGSLVLSQDGEAPSNFLVRAGAAGVTHLLGTPTHWRRALMSPAAAEIKPRYVRLSGEIADQAILDQLARAYPAAALTHAYASTEAGVGFEVRDGREGFPASVLGSRADGIEIKVVEGSLRLRSRRGAARYLGAGPALADDDGFIDTGDMVTERDGRYYFAGRRTGVINVGGQKVHPEEVEAVITRHPSVRMAQVRGRRSPITGTLVVAEIVLHTPSPPFAEIEREIIAACRAALPPHKVPAMLRQVDELAVAASGKLGRA
jgi:acyl-coenzyme A synthetase/AMP-(fatty) acid ligase